MQKSVNDTIGAAVQRGVPKKASLIHLGVLGVM